MFWQTAVIWKCESQLHSHMRDRINTPIQFEIYGRIFLLFRFYVKSTPKIVSSLSTVWKKKKFSLTKKIRQINSIVTYLVKPFTKFLPKMREGEFHSVVISEIFPTAIFFFVKLIYSVTINPRGPKAQFCLVMPWNILSSKHSRFWVNWIIFT